MGRQIYVHYGATEFDKTKNFPIGNESCWMKPKGGLWASRKNATFGWKEWCRIENFRDCDSNNSFEFTMRDESKIATISTLSQLYRLPLMEKNTDNSFVRYEVARSALGRVANLMQHSIYIDFEKCLNLGVDAIELCWYGDEYRNIANGDLHFALYGWDCDSIIVLNPDAVIPRQT